MVSMFKDKPGLAGLVQFGIIVFVGLSLINLWYSIRINKTMDEKINGKV